MRILKLAAACAGAFFVAGCGTTGVGYYGDAHPASRMSAYDQCEIYGNGKNCERFGRREPEGFPAHMQMNPNARSYRPRFGGREGFSRSRQMNPNARTSGPRDDGPRITAEQQMNPTARGDIAVRDDGPPITAEQQMNPNARTSGPRDDGPPIRRSDQVRRDRPADTRRDRDRSERRGSCPYHPYAAPELLAECR